MTVDQLRLRYVSNENNGLADLGYVSALLLHPDILSVLTATDRSEICVKALQLQAQLRERDGRSPGEAPAAFLAASTLTFGTSITTLAGLFDAASAFSTDAPNLDSEHLMDRSLDSLYAIGKKLLASVPKP